MKVVILAGGFGTRLSEETVSSPKPMVEIGNRPIIWHIMKLYSWHGFNEFVVCLGYKGYMIKQYFANYFLHMSDVTVDMKNNEIEVHQNYAEPWKVTLVDTGLNTMTGGRLKRVRRFVDGETFMLTYGDGVADVDLGALTAFHRARGKAATVTAVKPLGRFGRLDVDNGDNVLSFTEKPAGDGAWINGGFFVLEPAVFDYLGDDSCVWEREPLERLAADGQLSAYRHGGFWRPMDTLRDKMVLEDLWNSDRADWKVWA